MTFIDLDSIQFYQPLAKANLAGKRTPMASNSGLPVTCGEKSTPTVAKPGGGWDGRLDDCDLIEVLDLTGMSPKDPFDLPCKQTLDLKGTGINAEGNFHRLSFDGP